MKHVPWCQPFLIGMKNCEVSLSSEEKCISCCKKVHSTLIA